jgi:DNA-binding Lrp family transcriptional regulator
MVTAFTLLNVRRDAINETAQELLDIDGVAEVYSVAGDWDLVAIARARDNDALADIVTNHMLKIDTIVKSQTLVAFRAYSHYDLEAMFSIGLDQPGN